MSACICINFAHSFHYCYIYLSDIILYNKTVSEFFTEVVDSVSLFIIQPSINGVIVYFCYVMSH